MKYIDYKNLTKQDEQGNYILNLNDPLQRNQLHSYLVYQDLYIAAANKVIDAVTIEGPHPEFHEMVKQATWDNWPSLAKAIDHLLVFKDD